MLAEVLLPFETVIEKKPVQPFPGIFLFGRQKYSCLVHPDSLTCTTKRFLFMAVVGKGIISCFSSFTLDFFNIMTVK